jgi:hypothetical protein
MLPLRIGSAAPVVGRVPASTGDVWVSARDSDPCWRNSDMSFSRFLIAMPAAADTIAIPPALPPRRRLLLDERRDVLFPTPGMADVRLSNARFGPDFGGWRRWIQPPAMPWRGDAVVLRWRPRRDRDVTGVPVREKREAVRVGEVVRVMGLLPPRGVTPDYPDGPGPCPGSSLAARRSFSST